MYIQAEPPFAITKDPDGAQHAVRDSIQVTITGDLGEAKVNHRRGSKPEAGAESRWLHIHLKTRRVHIFVAGTHVVVTGKDYLPTFDLKTSDDLLNEAIKLMKADKNERGAYVVDTPNNRQVLARLFDQVRETESNRLLAWARHALARLTEK